MERMFFDTEFTGLQQNTTLISIGIVTQHGYSFYAEFSDYNREQVTPWISENVISKLTLDKKLQWNTDVEIESSMQVYGNTEYISLALRGWLTRCRRYNLEKGELEKIEMWGDCLAYDWVLFCELFAGAMNIPADVCYIPFDIATLFHSKDIDPDINREEYAGWNDNSNKKHNALYDAKVIRECHRKLTTKQGLLP